jgi:peptidoglycan/xylan/chitin deacetylase (PgdA/CDA1 family)
MTPGPGWTPVVHRILTQDPVVFITIDDGFFTHPDAAQLINDWQWPVTSFVLPMLLRKNPGYFESLGPDPVFGNHTASHRNLRGESLQRQAQDICAASWLIHRSTGSTPVWFRPPYGRFDANTLLAARQCRIKYTVLWDVVVAGARISMQNGHQIRPGDIILLHFRGNLATSLQVLKARLDALGLRPAPLGDYLK